VNAYVTTRDGQHRGSVASPTLLVVSKPLGCADIAEEFGETQVFFDLDSAATRDEARSTLMALKSRLGKGLPEGSQLQIDGYADIRGSVAYNVALSEKRAEATRDYLRDLGAVTDSQVKCIPFGEERQTPRGPNQSDEEWYAANRRAVIHLVCADR
jgi:peptidoglycan-associated lipoprotein